MTDPLEACAEYLLGLRLGGGTAGRMPEGLAPPDMASGYAVQARVVEGLLAARGGATRGYKIACTSKTAQRLVGTDAPVFGRLLSATNFEAPARLRADAFNQRIVEVEFAFRIGADVPRDGAPYTARAIAPFVAAVIPGIEIVDYRFATLDRYDAPSLAADNAIHGAWIRGAPEVGLAGLDLAIVATSLTVDGATVLTGRGDRVMGAPLAALAWLADELPRHGLGLRAGDIVTTGLSTDGIHAASRGEHLHADLGPVGSVDATFD